MKKPKVSKGTVESTQCFYAPESTGHGKTYFQIWTKQPMMKRKRNLLPGPTPNSGGVESILIDFPYKCNTSQRSCRQRDIAWDIGGEPMQALWHSVWVYIN